MCGIRDIIIGENIYKIALCKVERTLVYKYLKSLCTTGVFRLFVNSVRLCAIKPFIASIFKTQLALEEIQPVELEASLVNIYC